MLNDSSEQALHCLKKSIDAAEKQGDKYTQCLALEKYSRVIRQTDPQKAVGLARLAEKEYSMTAIPLVRNYRFKDNENMLNLDFNIRENAKTELAPSISNIAEVPAFWASTHEGEAKHIANKIIEIRAEDNRGKIAILSRARSYDIYLL